MNKDLPNTPADFLNIKGLFKFKMDLTCMLANIFKYWDRPKKAGASFEDMTTMDKFYWVYKCTRPVLRPESNRKFKKRVNLDSSIIGLPNSFKKTNSLTLGAAGDLFYSETLAHSKDRLYEDVADLLFEQDISYANFESPIGENTLKNEEVSDEAPPTESCTLEQFEIIKGHKNKNFNVLNTANNHMFDMGIEGVRKTQKALSDLNILDVGTNSRRKEWGQPKIISKNGIKLGFVSGTFGLNGRIMPPDENYCINLTKIMPREGEPDLDLIKKQVEDCKNQNCDFIIASLHWGYEFELFPREKQIEAAHEIVEFGADCILAHHAHVIQPVEYYRTKRDPNRIAVIAYSLGSLVWSFSAPYLALSTIINLVLTKGSFQEKIVTYIEQAKVTPVVRNSITSADGKIIRRVEKLTSNDNKLDEYTNKIRYYADIVAGRR